jgi:pseudouridine synthase
MKMILQKAIAQSGYASRRQAERLIRNGSVQVNGQVALVGDQADPQLDRITVQGRQLAAAPKKIYLRLNKPAGYTCTNREFKNERNIFELVNLPEKLFAVGRLDKDSRGLILLTNDGDLDQYLSHPSFEHNKVYEVLVQGQIRNSQTIINKLRNGIDIGEGDGIVHAQQAKYLQNNLFVITLSEGKKRQIRRMFQQLDLDVTDLKRVQIASLALGDLKEGQWSYLRPEEVKALQQ